MYLAEFLYFNFTHVSINKKLQGKEVSLEDKISFTCVQTRKIFIIVGKIMTE